ncbi:EI24 domain-containing protein [Algihabitans albus]|uniref:EI24 domain-containing protein n=1 Tax=Algihabitans albus TaxID=2164067 RepID=UPI000E5DA61B|nr:EI24 domain-containing protein [Algihabitans albus]
MVSALSKAFGQLSDPASRRVIWLTLTLSAGLLMLVWALAAWGLSAGAAGLQSWLGVEGFWAGLLEWLVGLGGFVALLFASAILFPGVAAGIISGLFIDKVCQAVEARHYPDLPPAREQPFGEAVGDGLKLLTVTVGLNLLLLPLYLIAAPLAPFVFFGVNGYLFGREYFEMIAVRRTASNQVRDLRQQNGGKVFFAGLVIALLMWIPIFNIIVPLVAAAFMLHVFEGLRRKSVGASVPSPA